MIQNFLINLTACGALISSVLVITSNNPVVAVVYLISVFLNAAGYLMLTGIGFIGISYIIVYVGAIVVLFLFVIMMINIKISEIIQTGTQYTKTVPLAITIGFLFIYTMFTILPIELFSNNVQLLDLITESFINVNGLLFNNYSLFNNLVYQTGNPMIADTYFANFIDIESVGNGLYTYGAIWLIITSIILLLAMVASLFISIKKG